MKRKLLLLVLAFWGAAAVAQNQCEMVRESGGRLLSNSTFEVSYRGPLKGCFTGYLPDDVTLEDGVYRFGFFGMAN